MTTKETTIRLPRRWANGTRIPRHPLLIGLERARFERKLSTRKIAIDHMGITQQALHQWVESCRADRDYLLPPDRVVQMSIALEIAPYYFRPDCWPTPEWTFKTPPTATSAPAAAEPLQV